MWARFSPKRAELARYGSDGVGLLLPWRKLGSRGAGFGASAGVSGQLTTVFPTASRCWLCLLQVLGITTG